MSQNLINAIDLPSGSLPTTPVVIKDNNLAGKFNVNDYKYVLGIPELTYIYIDGDNDNITSTEVIQFVENGYYPIIKVTSGSSSTKGESTAVREASPRPSDELYPGIWGFSYYFYEDNNPYAMFTCLQSFETSSSSAVDNIQLRSISYPVTDYLGGLNAPVVDSTGNWYSTTDLFTISSGGGGNR